MPLLLLLLSGRILSACQRPPPDATRYAQALSAETLDAAQRGCEAIGDVRLRGDCQVAAMEAWKQADPASCATVADPLWRDECTFLAAEQLFRSGEHDAANAACRQTRFARQCTWHLLQDTAEAAQDLSPAEAEAKMQPFLSANFRLPDAGMQFWSLWFRLQARAKRPIDGAACIGLTQVPACDAGLDHYLNAVLEARDRAGTDVCAAPLEEGWVDGPRVSATVARWVSRNCAD